MGENEALCGIQREIGELAGRMGSMENSLQDIGKSMQLLIERNALLAELHRMLIQHDKRLVTLENRCHERKGTLEAAAEHIANDQPVDVYMGRKALAAWAIVGGTILGFLATKLAEVVIK